METVSHLAKKKEMETVADGKKTTLVSLSLSIYTLLKYLLCLSLLFLI